MIRNASHQSTANSGDLRRLVQLTKLGFYYKKTSKLTENHGPAIFSEK